MKRILILSVCVALLICAFALPASAAGIDYNDYVSEVVVDGDNDLVTVRIPASLAYMRIYDYTDKTEIYEGFGANHSVDLIADHEYGFQLFPLGYPWSVDGGLDLDLIPDGTLTTIDFDMFLGVTDQLPMNATFYTIYRDSGGSSVNSSYVDYEFSGATTFSGTISDSSSSAAIVQYENVVFFQVPFDESGTFIIHDTVLTMSISSLLRQQQITGKTNKLLDKVNKQLEANGQKLDQIINDQVDPEAPVGSDIVGDIDDAEGQIRDEAQSGLDQGVEVQQSALDLIIQYASGFAVVGWIFNLFADIPFFSGLLYVSFALGIVSAILGLGLSVVNAGDARVRRNDAYYSRFGRSSRRSKGGA